MEEFDLAVIGAGINGAGIARDAAMRGLRVVIFEKNDLCSGTSWASSRLIHGGLRYLEYGEIPLVLTRRKTVEGSLQVTKGPLKSILKIASLAH